MVTSLDTHVHSNLALFLGSAPFFITAVLWWILGYKLVRVKTSSSGLLSIWNNYVREGGFLILNLMTWILLFDSVECDDWMYVVSWPVFFVLGVLLILDRYGLLDLNDVR
jgi:hypothetical protein